MIITTARRRMLCIVVVLAMSASIVAPYASAKNSTNPSVRLNSTKQMVDKLSTACASPRKGPSGKVLTIPEKCRKEMHGFINASVVASKSRKTLVAAADGGVVSGPAAVGAVILIGFAVVTLFSAYQACNSDPQFICSNAFITNAVLHAPEAIKQSPFYSQLTGVLIDIYQTAVPLLRNAKKSAIEKYNELEKLVTRRMDEFLRKKGAPVLAVERSADITAFIEELRKYDAECAKDLETILSYKKTYDELLDPFKPINDPGFKKFFNELKNVRTLLHAIRVKVSQVKELNKLLAHFDKLEGVLKNNTGVAGMQKFIDYFQELWKLSTFTENLTFKNPLDFILIRSTINQALKNYNELIFSFHKEISMIPLNTLVGFEDKFNLSLQSNLIDMRTDISALKIDLEDEDGRKYYCSKISRIKDKIIANQEGHKGNLSKNILYRKIFNEPAYLETFNKLIQLLKNIFLSLNIK